MLLVTGGAGFIGSNVVHALNKKNRDDIIIADNLENGLKCLNLSKIKFHDFIDYRELFATRAYEKMNITGVIHLGAKVDTSNWNGREMILHNYTYSKDLFNFTGTQAIRFVYASSAGVYGSSGNFSECLENEKPQTPYAVSKWMFDQYVRQRMQYSFVYGLRYFNVYGRNEQHKGSMSSFPYKCVNAIKNQKPITFFNFANPAIYEIPGEYAIPYDIVDDVLRDFVFVDDVAEITTRFALQPEFREAVADKSGIYNVGSGASTNLIDVVEIAVVAAPRIWRPTIPPIKITPMPDSMERGYQRHTCADLTALGKIFPDITANWFTPITEGIKKLFENEEFFSDDAPRGA
jgi:ADP-L-glycero-D-manno-heptose 6-epimerase